MITEDYVSFEIAKLLKERGFSENTEHKIWYVIKQFSTGCHWNSCTYKVGDITREYNDDCCIPMPTLQMAMKWLREVHNLHCDIGYDDLDWFWNIISVDNTVPVEDRPKMLKNGFAGFNSLEKACESAIKYCLENLI